MSVIVIEFVTLDGTISDPDGTEGTDYGGWAFRHGPEAVAGDKFRLGETLDNGTLVLGRLTWQKFAGLFPHRDDPFSLRMNAVPKLVASRTVTDVSAWANSTVIEGDVVEAIKRHDRDVIIAGSVSVVNAVADLVDEYRLLIFPTIAGTGRRLFPDERRPAHLTTVTADRAGPAVFATYTVSGASDR